MVEVWKPTSGNIARLTASERIAWGLERVPRPPDALFEVLGHAREIQFPLAPHYCPDREFADESLWPQGVEQSSSYTEHLPDDANRLPGAWVLFDTTRKPNVVYPFQPYPDDGPAMKGLLKQLRERGGIEVRPWASSIGEESRAGVNHMELSDAVFPAIAKLLEVPVLDGAVVRSPRWIEWNIIAKMFYPYLGDTNIYEWMNDASSDERFALIGGNSQRGGLANVRFQKRDEPHWYIGFRPMIVFPK